MGVAALVLGIISLIIGFIPLCGAIALVPAIVGLILGIVDIVKKSKEEGAKKGLAIAGTVLSAIAICIIIWWVFIFGAAASNLDTNELQNALNSLNSIDTTY